METVTVTNHSIGHDSFHRDNGFSLPGKVSEFFYCGALAPSSACRAKHIPKGERKEVVVHFVKMMLLCLGVKSLDLGSGRDQKVPAACSGPWRTDPKIDSDGFLCKHPRDRP